MSKDKRRLPPLWMPVRVAEFVADTAHFTAEQTGAYFRLLCAMWRQGGSLSDDKAKLARTAGVHPPHFPRVWDAIGNEFTSIDGGKLTNDNLHAELMKANTIIEVKRE